MEIWKDIIGYEGKYQVSSFGNVRSSITPNLAKHKTKNGYISIQLSKQCHYKRHLVHRLVAAAFIQKPHGSDYVNHIDCNKGNNDVTNLEWVTKSENAKHAYRNGLLNILPLGSRKMKIFLYEYGILIKEFDSQKSVCDFLNKPRASICRAVNNGSLIDNKYKLLKQKLCH